MMRILSAIAVLLASLISAAPAQAFEFNVLLTRVFGSSDPKDLGLPIFGLIAVAAIAFFWGALRIGKKRQSRIIDNYHADLKDYSTHLRRGK
ncbi:hypothetical protein PZ897_09560 [Hoeflea sp. YIM 152468]|uniref:hypothetical protein n=1 Tax=Hoeflea sp. YIM 152468 TaxID=3031759 RepID=UPI0023DBE119|nr:hypothetical protein [Hoeflea sp. YIM 152468]MDF1608422.1 hypothetical protein [Hoeflea sp. YIM 152468]